MNFNINFRKEMQSVANPATVARPHGADIAPVAFNL